MNAKVPFVSRVVAPYAVGVAAMLCVPEDKFQTVAMRVYQVQERFMRGEVLFGEDSENGEDQGRR